jgi:hypothetical protein
MRRPAAHRREVALAANSNLSAQRSHSRGSKTWAGTRFDATAPNSRIVKLS